MGRGKLSLLGRLFAVILALGAVVAIHAWTGSGSIVMVSEALAQTPSPSPSPAPGTPCSPGYWKNHLSEFNKYCDAAAALPGDRFTTCGELLTALTCKGSDASCGRSEAAAALNAVSGCTE